MTILKYFIIPIALVLLFMVHMHGEQYFSFKKADREKLDARDVLSKRKTYFIHARLALLFFILFLFLSAFFVSTASSQQVNIVENGTFETATYHSPYNWTMHYGSAGLGGQTDGFGAKIQAGVYNFGGANTYMIRPLANPAELQFADMASQILEEINGNGTLTVGAELYQDCAFNRLNLAVQTVDNNGTVLTIGSSLLSEAQQFVVNISSYDSSLDYRIMINTVDLSGGSAYPCGTGSDSRVDNIYAYWEPIAPEDDHISKKYCVGAVIDGENVYTITDNESEAGAIPVNVLQNSSFELGGIVPDDWEAQNPLNSNDNYRHDGGRTGSGYLTKSNSGIPQRYEQSVSLVESHYLIGGYYYNTSLTINGAIRLGIGSVTLSTTGGTEYEEIEAVVDNYGNLKFIVDLPEANNPLDFFDFRFDDAYLVPVNADLINDTYVINCEAVDEINNTGENPIVDPGSGGTQTISGLPVPLYGAGTVCYSCPWPPSADIGVYLAWLACVIRNMFSCDLYHWLLNIENGVVSLFAGVMAQTNWFSSEIQRYATWFGMTANSGIDFVYAMYSNISASLNGEGITVNNEAETSWFDVLVALVDLPAQIANSIANTINSLANLLSSSAVLLSTIFSILAGLLSAVSVPLFAVIDLLYGVIDALLSAASAPEVTTTEFVELTGLAINESSAEFSIFILSTAFVNSIFVDFPELLWVFAIVFGGVGIRVALWLLSAWRGVFNI